MGRLGQLDMTLTLSKKEAIPPDELDRSDFESKLEQARSEADNAEEDSEEKRLAERDVKRYEAFLETGESS